MGTCSVDFIELKSKNIYFLLHFGPSDFRHWALNTHFFPSDFFFLLSYFRQMQNTLTQCRLCDKRNTSTSWFYFLISVSTCPAAQFHAKSMPPIASHISYSRCCLTVCARAVLPITASHLGVCVIASCNFTLRIRFTKWDKNLPESCRSPKNHRDSGGYRADPGTMRIHCRSQILLYHEMSQHINYKRDYPSLKVK